MALSVTRCARSAALLAWLALGTACSVRIPDGAYVCERDSDCPPALACVSGYCYRHAPDGGAPDTAILDDDAGCGDGCSSPDAAPPDDDAGCPGATCEAAPAVESCNGEDDDDDGFIDESLLSLAPLSQLDHTLDPFHVRLFTRDDGTLIAVTSELDPTTQLSAIYASALAADGTLTRRPTHLADAINFRFEAAIAGDTLGLVRGTPDALVVSSFALDDFSPVLPDTPLPGLPEARVLDLATTVDALGPVLWAVHDASGVTTLSSVRGHPAGIQQNSIIVNDPAITGAGYEDARLVAAPCSRALYVQLRGPYPDSLVRLIGFSPSGTPIAGLDLLLEPGAPADDAIFTVARPVLVGGDCKADPDTLITAFGRVHRLSDDTTDGYLDVHSVDLAVAKGPTPEDAERYRLTIPIASPPVPDGLFPQETNGIALGARADGQLFALSSLVDITTGVGDLALFEVTPDGRYVEHATGVAPGLPGAIDIYIAPEPGGPVYVATSAWLDGQPAELLTLGCE